ncbi:hypothetical protein C8A03DRAFT_36921 [Achaetomium macrosporum]|uniref:Uncharacterized protein n=1 Tax=Achaetomium macrosporum TaxID=79813 RepID=A0AAN7C5R1_9PEZI|nr:hypothetical protein C8A03DRAFT_36921 [Achaetomium macrosporum]
MTPKDHRPNPNVPFVQGGFATVEARGGTSKLPSLAVVHLDPPPNPAAAVAAGPTLDAGQVYRLSSNMRFVEILGHRLSIVGNVLFTVEAENLHDKKPYQTQSKVVVPKDTKVKAKSKKRLRKAEEYGSLSAPITGSTRSGAGTGLPARCKRMDAPKHIYANKGFATDKNKILFALGILDQQHRMRWYSHLNSSLEDWQQRVTNDYDYSGHHPTTVDWYVILCLGTYSAVLEDKMCRKMVPEILFTGRIPQWIDTPNLGMMVALEILRMKCSHPFNRFAWIINPPANIEDSASPIMERMGVVEWTATLVKVIADRETTAAKVMGPAR